LGAPSRYRQALAGLPLFQGLDAGHIDRIWDLGSFNIIPAGTTLMRDGEQGMEAYLILEGTVEVLRPDGQRIHVGPYELVGEMSLLENGTNRRSATVTTLDPIRCLVLNRHYFQRLLIDEPLLHEHIKARIAEYTTGEAEPVIKEGVVG
jgi:CRP-like cAMP-binding protein